LIDQQQIEGLDADEMNQKNKLANVWEELVDTSIIKRDSLHEE